MSYNHAYGTSLHTLVHTYGIKMCTTGTGVLSDKTGKKCTQIQFSVTKSRHVFSGVFHYKGGHQIQWTHNLKGFTEYLKVILYYRCDKAVFWMKEYVLWLKILWHFFCEIGLVLYLHPLMKWCTSFKRKGFLSGSNTPKSNTAVTGLPVTSWWETQSGTFWLISATPTGHSN